jgi:ABC-2 type transport system permease protein
VGPPHGPGALTVAVAYPRAPQVGRILPGFAIIGWRWISRHPAMVVGPVLVPFIFLYFLRLISPPQDFPLQVIGAMLFTTQNIGSWVLGDSATYRLEAYLEEMFIASPVSRLQYMIGLSLSNLIAAVPALVVLAVVLALVTPVPWYAWPILVAVILLLWLLVSAIGMAVSTRIRSRRVVWPVGSLVFTVLGMLSPLYYPLSVLPPDWQTVTRFFPATYAALLVQGAVNVPGVAPSNLWIDGGLLILFTTVGTAVALSFYQWRDD